MPSPINTLPLGLLDFLTAKTLGVNPNLLADSVAPTVDLAPFYIAGQLERVQSPLTAVNAIGNFLTTLVVPNQELWFVQLAAASTDTMPAGISTRIRAILTDSQGQRLYLANNSSGAVAAGERGASVLSNPFIAPPGSQFGLTCEQLTGAGYNFVALASIVRLTV